MAENDGNSHVEGLLEDRRWACALARSLVHDEHLADDVVQSAYLATLEHKPPHEVSAKAWFAGVVRNVAKMTLRGGARRKTRERNVIKDDLAPSAAELVALAEQHHRLASYVVELEEPYRSAIIQRYFGALEPSVIAARSGEPAATVRSRLKRGLEKLRARLEDSEGSEWRASLAPLAAAPGMVLPGVATVMTIAAVTKVAVVFLLVLAIGATAWRVVGSRADEKNAGAAAARGRNLPLEERTGLAAADVPALKPKPFADPTAVAVRGRVVDAAGAPVAGARVITFPPDIERTVEAAKPDEAGSLARSGLTDAFGRFELMPGRASGLVNVFAEHRGHSPAVLECRRPSDDLLLEMEPERSMSGRVTDAAGGPLAGARVRWQAVLCGVSFVRETATDHDGGYQLGELLTESIGVQTSRPPVAEVAVSADGFATAYLAPPVADDEGRMVLDAVLDPGLSLAGTVIDAATSLPIAGAKVAFWTQREHTTAPGPAGRLLPDPKPVKGLSETTADSGGRFVLTQLTPQARAGGRAGAAVAAFGLVAATAPGYGAAIQTVSIGPGNKTAEVVLACRVCGGIRGQLADGTGRALAGVPVWLEPRVGSESLLPAILAAERGSQVTAADGTFVFDGVRADGDGALLDLVARPLGTLGTPFRRSRIEVRAGSVTNLGEVRIGSVASLGVLVVDWAGRPLFGARVSIAPFVDGEAIESQSVATDVSGRATIYRLEPTPGAGHGIARVFAQHPGHARGSAFTDKEQSGHDLRIVLHPEHVFRGRVCDDGGAPVVDAQVWLVDARWPANWAFVKPGELEIPADRLPSHFAAVLTSRAGGQFVVPGLAHDRFHVAARRSTGWSREPVFLYDVEAGPEVVVKLPPVDPVAAPGDLEVAVSDGATSHPLMDARVKAYTATSGDLRGDQALGVYRFGGLPDGMYTVTVQARGFVERVLNDVDVKAGLLKSLDVKLERGLTVRGSVTRVDGVPFVNAEIGLFADEPVLPPSASPLDADGRFVISGIAPGRDYAAVVIEHSPLGFTVFTPVEGRKVALPKPGAELKLRVAAGGVAWFKLGGARGEEREALRASRIVVTDTAGATALEVVSPSKTVVPVSLPPGSYRASIVRGDATVDEKPFVVTIGESVDVSLSLR